MNRFQAVLLVSFFFALCSSSGCSSDRDSEVAWEIREELRIGNQMGGGPDMFGIIAGLSIGPNGQVYVYDSSDQEIRVFDRSGRFVRRFGRAGKGPGEFGWVWGMTWAPDGRFWIIDSRNMRYSIFDSTGTFIEDHPCPVSTRDAQITGFDLAGNFYDQTAYVDSENVYRRELIKMTSEGKTVDTIPLPEVTVQSLEMGPMRFPIPFSRRMVTCFDPSGYIWYGISDRYEISRMELDGSTTMVRLISDDVIPLSQADRDSVNNYLDRLKSRFRMASVPGDIIPQAKPIFDGIFLNHVSGDIWVKLIDYTGEGTILDIYSSGTRTRGSARCGIPMLSDPAPVILGGEIWFVTEDELGAQYIVRGVLK